MAGRLRNSGRLWDREEISRDCVHAQELFRLRRISEPLEDYLAEFTAARAAAESVIDRLPQILAEPADSDLLASIAANPSHFTALRYLAAPPISEDDLDTLLAQGLSAKALRSDRALAATWAALIRQTLDPYRFPWIAEGREPTEGQRQAATLATAVAATIQRVQTKRRGYEKKDLEGAVERLLTALGFRRLATPRTPIQNSEDLPGPGLFMVGATLGADNADCVLGLPDRRRLALECKSSNSEINSRKRLNKEVVKDAENWRRQFGNQVVSGAVLRGVFNPRYVQEAQETPLLIFWGHRLEDIREFIQAAQ